MAVSKKQQACVNRYMSTHYDSLRVFVPIGQKSSIQQAAKAAAQSTNAYITQAIAERMQRDGFELQSSADAEPDEDA